MIYVRITEGLGNQLYKYACGYAIAKENNDEMMLDLSGFKYDPRDYMLDKMKISARIADFKPPIKNTKLYRIIGRISRIVKLNVHGPCRWVKENPKTYCKFANYDFSYNRNLYLEGYWQNYKYFDKFYEDLCAEFSPKDGIISKQALEIIGECKNTNSVSIHIRRGDYSKEWLISDDYYSKAINYIYSTVPNPRFYIFCEDITYFYSKLGHLRNHIFITDKYKFSDVEEFYIMSSCRHQITANSTYSWWAAYLNKYEEKVIVAPDYLQWTGDYYPENWQTIKI